MRHCVRSFETRTPAPPFIASCFLFARSNKFKKMETFPKFYCALIIVCYLSLGHALECYVCTDQEGNKDKCLNTIKTCEQGQDVCFTEIKWGSTPYWSQGAKKQFYISKRCSTKRECERIRQNNMPDCTHIWYQDWKCSDCCQGDKCNYYVISGAQETKAQYGIFAIAILTALSSLWHTR